LTKFITDEIHNFVLRHLGAHLPGCSIYAFGSRIRGDAQTYSDLDLGIDFGAEIPLGKLVVLNSIFSESDIPYKIDIVDMQSVDPEFKEHIIKTSRKWS